MFQELLKPGIRTMVRSDDDDDDVSNYLLRNQGLKIMKNVADLLIV
jgi:hypothetical protein